MDYALRLIINPSHGVRWFMWMMTLSCGLGKSLYEKRDDHVAFYIVEKFDMKESYSPEIAEKKWFSFNDLPLEMTPSTKNRIEEFLGQQQRSDTW